MWNLRIPVTTLIPAFLLGLVVGTGMSWVLDLSLHSAGFVVVMALAMIASYAAMKDGL